MLIEYSHRRVKCRSCGVHCVELVALPLPPPRVIACRSIRQRGSRLRLRSGQGPVLLGPATSAAEEECGMSSRARICLKLLSIGAGVLCVDCGSSTPSGGADAASDTSTVPSDAAVDDSGPEVFPDTATDTITAPPAAPVFTPPGGDYFGCELRVALASPTAGVEMFYTRDGSIPTATSTRYASPVPVKWAMTLRAIAVMPAGPASAVASAEYRIGKPPGIPPGPQAMPSGGSFESDPVVALAWKEGDFTLGKDGVAICYTVDGSTPSCGVLDGKCQGATLTYKGPFSIKLSSIAVKLRAIGCHDCYGASSERQEVYAAAPK